MNAVERTLRRIDAFQQRHRAIAFPFAVVKKFGDDQAGNLAALIAYYGFFSLFPLLLVFVTILGIFLDKNSGLGRSILNSALAEFPIIGDQIRRNVHSISGDGLAMLVGILGTLWGGLGVMQALQTAMNRVWDVPMRQRPNFWKSRVRALLMLVLLGVSSVGSAVVAGIASAGGTSPVARVGGYVLSLALNLGVFMLAFRILTARRLSWGDVLPGALVAAVAWLVLQGVGGYVVGHQLKSASQVYGLFALVIGLLTWMYLGAQLTLYAAEVNVVRKERLWPRSLVQPPLSEADRRAYRRAAIAEERRPEEDVKVRFDDETVGESHMADRRERDLTEDVEEPSET
ncbi:MAG: YihY/virulence factor BrkB family protein [Actinomycetota bacterium]